MNPNLIRVYTFCDTYLYAFFVSQNRNKVITLDLRIEIGLSSMPDKFGWQVHFIQAKYGFMPVILQFDRRSGQPCGTFL